MVASFRLFASTFIALLILAAETGRWLIIDLCCHTNLSRASLTELPRSNQRSAHMGPAEGLANLHLDNSTQHLTNFSLDMTQLLWFVSQKPIPYQPSSRFIQLATGLCHQVTVLPSPSIPITPFFNLATTLNFPIRLSTSSFSPPFGPLQLNFDLTSVNYLDSRTLNHMNCTLYILESDMSPPLVSAYQQSHYVWLPASFTLHRLCNRLGRAVLVPIKFWCNPDAISSLPTSMQTTINNNNNTLTILQALVPTNSYMPYLNCSKGLGEVKCRGIMADLFKLYCKFAKLVCNYSLQIGENENVFSSLRDGRTHLQVSGYTIKSSRWGLVDFGFPFLTKQDYIFTRMPEVKVDPWGLLTIFDVTTYVLIGVSILLVCLLFILLSVHRSLAEHSSTIVYLLAAFFQETFPQSRLPWGSLRIILQWYFYSMTITFMYQCVLINKLTVAEFDRPVDSIGQLLAQDLTPLIFYKSSNIEEWKNSKDGGLRRLGQRLEGFRSDREAVERLHSEKGLAVLSSRTTMEYEMFLQKKQETYISREGRRRKWIGGLGS